MNGPPVRGAGLPGVTINGCFRPSNDSEANKCAGRADAGICSTNQESSSSYASVSPFTNT